MTVLIILAISSLAGIGAVFWLLKSEEESKGVSIVNKAEPLESAGDTTPGPEEQAPEQPPAAKESKTKSNLIPKLLANLKEKIAKIKKGDGSSTEKESSSLIEKLLAKLNLGKKDAESNEIADVSHLPSFSDQAEENKIEKPPSEEPQTGTVSITTAAPQEPEKESSLSQKEEEAIGNEIDLSSQLSELAQKNEKLDALLKEKGAELEETKKSLDNELRTRKEFNKVKDILEKEIRDLKDKTRSVQVGHDDAMAEGANHKKRVIQLEEKVTKLEKNLLEKEDKVNELVKRMQTFASPSTASTPPTAEEPAKEKIAPEPPPENQPEPVTEETPAAKPPQQPKEAQTQPPAEPSPKSQPEPVAEETPSEPEPPIEEVPVPESPQQPKTEEAQEPEEPPQKEEFLKLQPDVLSEEPPKEGPIAAEIERSLQPKEPETPSKPDQPPPEEKKILEIIDPEKAPETPPANSENAEPQTPNNENDSHKE